MRQVPTTMHAIRAAIQRSKAPLKELAARYGLNRKTVAKWRKRSFLHDAPMGPKAPRSTVLTAEDEAVAVAFRKHTLPAAGRLLCACCRRTIPHLTRSGLQLLLPAAWDQQAARDRGRQGREEGFRALPARLLYIDIAAEVRTEEGKLYLFVAVDRTSKYAFAPALKKATRARAVVFLDDGLIAVPVKTHPHHGAD